MKVTKNQSDKPMKEKNKHGGAQEESRRIKKHADQWCKDNGYPLQTRYYLSRRYGGMMSGAELHRASYTATNRGPSKPKKGPYEI